MRHIRFAFRRRALDSWPPFCLNFFSVNRRSEEAQIWGNDLGGRNGEAFRGPPTFLTRKFLQERSEEEEDHFFLFPPTDGFCPSVVPRLISHSPSFPANEKEKRREAFAKKIFPLQNQYRAKSEGDLATERNLYFGLKIRGTVWHALPT